MSTQYGMDPETGKWVSGWDSVVVAIGKLLSTRYFERVLREYVGSPVPTILGQTANVQTILKFRWALVLAIELFEPRFKPTKVTMDALDRKGNSTWTIRGTYRPRAHLGDLTEAGEVSLSFGSDGTSTIIAG
ncbi:baseplate assembly protein [Agrobacterium vitis]|uniref:GPW/gp25 family protein n=1 Tax=Agrobacterium vitis TaxID=373 RepID=UPI001F21A4C1|nr:GPW/gp25 family protein [Agrobacterium vitis]MCE6073389.1 baseplate assembly protein [Agrobacterium vitis]